MRLLLETHRPAALVRQLQQRGIGAVAVQDWHAGAYRTAADEDILAAAARDSRTLVTFDLRTIPACLKTLAEAGGHHAGVILVSPRAFSPTDIGRLLDTLVRLSTTSGDRAWRDRVVYLAPTDQPADR